MLIDDLLGIELALNQGVIDIDEAEDLIDRAVFNDRLSDVLAWGKYYFPDKFDLPFCEELHRYLIATAEDELTSTLAPRRHAKTTIRCFLIPIYYALNYPEKYRHFVNIQSTTTKSIAINLSIRREIEGNERLIGDYGNLIGADKWTEQQFVLKNGVIFSAVGAGESFRGKNYRNIRPDYIILDDIYDDADISSPDRISKIDAWFWATVYKATAPGRKTSIQVAGTAINSGDLMHKLKKSERCTHKTFVACDFETGYLLWPENNTIESLLSDRELMGSIIFNREMLNQLRDDHDAIIKSHYIQVIDRLPPGLSLQFKIGAIDPAEKTKEINDYTAKVVIYVTPEKDVYIVDIRNDKYSFNENKLDVIQMHDEHKLAIVPFETNKAYGLYEELKRTTGVPVRERITTNDKITRLISVSAFFENKKVFFVKEKIKQALLTEAIDQCIYNHPTHDDIRDAIVLALEEVKKLRQAFVG